MTNRPEYLSAVFGTALAGGVSVGLSHFSTTNEMDYLLAASGVSFVLFDGRILKRDFGAMLAELEPQIHRVAPGQLQSRSEEHTSELQSLMRISYAVFCLKKKKTKKNVNTTPVI